MERAHRAYPAALSAVLMISTALLVGVEASAAPVSDYVFAVTSDYEVSGRVSTIDVIPSWSVDPNVGSVHSDADARYYDGLIYVVNHLYGDNIQVIDPEQDFATIRQFSVGPGSNPQDIAFVSSTRAYVSRYETPWLYEVNPTTGAVTDSIDLGPLADPDGIPEMAEMAVWDDLLFVAVQRLDQDNYWIPVPPSYLAVIDTNTNQLVDVDPGTPGVQGIALTATNPYTEILEDQATGTIYVGESGDWLVWDGGIEAVDPVSLTALGFVSTEAQLGGDIYDFTLPLDGRAHAVVAAWSGDWEQFCVSFDWTTGQKLQDVWKPGGYNVMDVETHPGTAQLFLCDRTYTNPGVRVFDATDDHQLTSSPLNVGLPPHDLLVVGSDVTGVPDGETVPEPSLTVAVSPNPFRARTVIEFSLAKPAAVEVAVYDLGGRLVRTLARGPRSGGSSTLAWDGTDERGHPVAAGVYFVRVRSGGGSGTAKALLVR